MRLLSIGFAAIALFLLVACSGDDAAQSDADWDARHAAFLERNEELAERWGRFVRSANVPRNERTDDGVPVPAERWGGPPSNYEAALLVEEWELLRPMVVEMFEELHALTEQTEHLSAEKHEDVLALRALVQESLTFVRRLDEAVDGWRDQASAAP